MIEKIMQDYLTSKLTNISVYMERPETPPRKYVIIEKTGSDKTDQVETATMAFQSYADSLYEAAALNDTVKGVVEGAVELSSVSGVHLNTDYNFTSTASKQYRYQAVFLVTHY